MITCTRRYQFCAGHRVMGHENKCAHLHGHNYVALITAETKSWHPELDSVGRVVDFSLLKDKIGGWIDKYWDHGFILSVEDHFIHDLLVVANIGKNKTQKVFLLPTNPTAENMADYLLREVCPAALRDMGIEVKEVTIWETENCYATARLEEGVETDADQKVHGAGPGPEPDTTDTNPGDGSANSGPEENTLTPDGKTTSPGKTGNVISSGYLSDGAKSG